MKWKFSAEENQTYQVDEEGFHVKNKLFLWSTTSVTKVAIIITYVQEVFPPQPYVLHHDKWKKSDLEDRKFEEKGT